VEERKEIVKGFVARGMLVKQAAMLAGMSKSTYYYRPTGGKPGKRPTRTTRRPDGQAVDNGVVVQDIKAILSPDFIDYGYDKVTVELKRKDYIINHKKVERLMREHKLLLRRGSPPGPLRAFVKFSQPCPGQPFEVLEVDIKYVHIHGERRNAYLITVLDTFTRYALVWSLAFSMKSQQVQGLVDQLILEYLQPHDMLAREIQVTMRSDNGSQFVARLIREHLKDNQILQEFIKPRTPEQNGHIESFHSVVEKLVTSRFEFESIHHARAVFTDFYHTYNNERILKVLLYKAPAQFLELWYNDRIQVVYDIKTKKQSFFFREKQDARPAPPPEDLCYIGLCEDKDKFALCETFH